VFPGVAQAKSFRRAAERIRLSQVPSTSTLSANGHDALRGLRARSAAAEAAFHYRGRSGPAPPATLCTGQGRIRPGWMIVLCVHALRSRGSDFHPAGWAHGPINILSVLSVGV
jgi:hypothetical protein